MLKLTTLMAAFFITFSAFSADLAGCLPQLEKALCYGPPVKHWTESDNKMSGLKNFQERKCLPLAANIKQTLISVYQKYPREIQQAFCEIKKVFIVSGEVSYGALADYYFDLSTVKIQKGDWNAQFSGKPTGYILEISEKARFKGETASAYLTRVLRARFGNVNLNTDTLPEAKYETPFAENGALATTIVHEIGHMLGRAQKVTSTYFLPFSEGAWSKNSFKLEDGSYSLLHATSDFNSQFLSKKLSLTDIQPTFDLFRKAGIATLYGATSPQEDLAEFFMLSNYGNLKWYLQGEEVLDLQNEMVNNPVFKAKREIIRKLMSLPQPFSLKNRIVSGEIEAF